MRKIRRAFIALICLLLAAAVLLFTLENKQQVELSFLSYTSPALPLAFTILIGFVAGAFFAAAFSSSVASSANPRGFPSSSA